MSSAEVRDSERSAFRALLTTAGAVRVGITTFVPLWAVAAPRLVGDPRQTLGLATTLDELTTDGTIELSGSSDTSTIPPLPKFVTVISARRAPKDRPWLRFAWGAQLGWVSSLPTLTPKQFEQLTQINAWLARTAGHDTLVVPQRFRSAELFADEKALDHLAGGALFASGRISYELLHCARFPPPLAAAAVGDGPDVLIVENSDPYWVAVDALRRTTGHPIRAVIWGGGKSFPAQIPSLGIDVAGLGPVTGTAWYWGDLDPTGVRIAVDSAAIATAAGVAPIRPPAELWAALVHCDVTDPGKHNWTDAGREWFGEQLWAVLEPVRTSSGRIAQEAIRVSVVHEWAAQLCG